MKTVIIIPIHKQSKNLDRIIYGLERQTEKSFKALFMLDRPASDELNEMIAKINDSSLDAVAHVIGTVPDGITNRVGSDEIFLTPYIRNEGIRIAKEWQMENFIFIDGDCIPQENLVYAHNYTSSRGLPVLSVGRRREEKHNWRDQREVDRSLSMLNLFRRDGMVINNLQMLKSSIIVWSCNISLNISAINLMEKFNSYYYGKAETFSGQFSGTWGGEDGFLGIEAYYAGLYINMIGDTRAGVKHIDHPRPISKYGHEEHMRFLALKTKELGEMMIKKPLILDFFSPN